MADKQLTFDEDARASLMRGVDELKRVVGLTLGPNSAFVLVPLAELAPDSVHPVLGVTIGHLAEQVDGLEGVIPLVQS